MIKNNKYALLHYYTNDKIDLFCHDYTYYETRHKL